MCSYKKIPALRVPSHVRMSETPGILNTCPNSTALTNFTRKRQQTEMLWQTKLESSVYLFQENLWPAWDLPLFKNVKSKETVGFIHWEPRVSCHLFLSLGFGISWARLFKTSISAINTGRIKLLNWPYANMHKWSFPESSFSSSMRRKKLAGSGTRLTQKSYAFLKTMFTLKSIMECVFSDWSD